MFDEYLSKFNEQAIKDRAYFYYHNGVVNQSIDMVFLLKHYEYVTGLGIAPNPTVLKDFLLASRLIKNEKLPDPFEYLSIDQRAEIASLDITQREAAEKKHKETIENLKNHYQHYSLINWMVVLNAQAYKEKIKPFLNAAETTVEQSQAALNALKQALVAYISQYGESYKTDVARQTSWTSLDYYLRKLADEHHYHDVSYDLAGIKFRFNPRMELASKFLLTTAVLGLILMLSFGYMADYGVWSTLFYVSMMAAASFPYLSISHMHRSIRNKAAQHHDEFQGIFPVESHHTVAVIAFFSAFIILGLNMYALISADVFAVTMVTFTLLALAAATAYEYASIQAKNTQTRTLSNEMWIATQVDRISEDKIKLDVSDRYFNHTRAMFLSAGDDTTKQSLIYRRHMYEAAYKARSANSALSNDTFHDDLMKQDKFYQGNAFVNEAIDFVAAVMAVTTFEASRQWLSALMLLSDTSGTPNLKTVDEFSSMKAYIIWINQTVPLYLKSKNGPLQPLTEKQKELLAKTNPNPEDCKALDVLRAEYPQYHLLKACASLSLEYKTDNISAYRIEIEKRILAAIGPQLSEYTGAPFKGKTLESLHLALRQAQGQFGYWSLAAIPSQCRSLDYQSTLTLAALGLTMATAMVASLVYADAVDVSFKVGWMGFALTCAFISVIASVAWDGELHKKMDVKQKHKDTEQIFKLAPSKVALQM